MPEPLLRPRGQMLYSGSNESREVSLAIAHRAEAMINSTLISSVKSIVVNIQAMDLEAAAKQANWIMVRTATGPRCSAFWRRRVQVARR